MDGTIPGMILGMDGMLPITVMASIAGVTGDGIIVPVGVGIILPTMDTDGAILDIIIMVITELYMLIVHQIQPTEMVVSVQEPILADPTPYLVVMAM